MNIGFDIDGVMTCLEKFQIEYGSVFFKKKYNMNIVNPCGETIRKIFECSKEQEYEFWKHYIFFYATKYPMRIGCAETIKKIKDDATNINIFIITSRIKASDNDLLGFIMRYLVKTFLKDIPYENIIFCPLENTPEAKKNACMKYKIDLMVEDIIDNILAIKDISKVVCFNASYNQILPEDVMGIDYYDELYRIVNRLNRNSELKILTREERQALTEDDLKAYYHRLQNYYTKRIDYENLQKTEKIYEFLYPVLKKIFDKRYPYTIINEKNILKSDGAIYIANHRDMIDPPLIMSAIGRRPTHLLLKSEFKDSIFEPFLSNIGCFYVDRNNKDSQIIAKDNMIKAALANSNVIVLPEGTRNKTDCELLPFKLGAVSVARISQKPIVPIGIFKKFNDFGTDIILNVGEAINISFNDDIVEKNLELQETVKKLILEGKEYQLSKRR